MLNRTRRSTTNSALRTLLAGVVLATCAPFVAADDPPAPPANTPPAGFVPLFNGTDLTGWKGLVADPPKRAKMKPEELAEAQQQADEQIRQHWRVADGQIVADGHGPHLCTSRDYADFELWLDWKISPGADSGIYLRGAPQVQIWDPTGGYAPAKVGSGGLYNNQKHVSLPLVKADRPAGEWNTFYIQMIGERVTVRFNGQLVVDRVPMENYWERGRPIYPSGQIELQTHGGEVRFRNLFIREIPGDEANRILRQEDAELFKPLFNGKDLEGWHGGGYTFDAGILVCQPGAGGFFRTTAEYADFVMRLEFKLPPGGNNGLVIRSGPHGPLGNGIELQILDDSAAEYAKLAPYQYHGSIYGAVGAHRGYQRPVGEWNYQEVTCRGPQITVKLNGTTIVDADVSTIDKPARAEAKGGLVRRAGHVGFLGHGTGVEFRSVVIRELEVESSAAKDE